MNHRRKREEMFESSVRSRRERAGVFEYESSVGYFYLYDTKAEAEAHRVLAAIPILAAPPDFSPRDLQIEWDPDESMVGR